MIVFFDFFDFERIDGLLQDYKGAVYGLRQSSRRCFLLDGRPGMGWRARFPGEARFV